MKLAAGLAAILLASAALIGGTVYARRVERGSIHALAAPDFDQKDRGRALQAEAFRQPDLLPLYGSSELVVRQYEGPYHASDFFAAYPTGFTVFPVGRPGMASLIILQALASVGPDLHDKKVVISLSPTWFFFPGATDRRHYAGNFSHLHADRLVFSGDLSFDLKQQAARRLLQFPDTLEGDVLLRFALERLADGSPVNRAIYYAMLPLGEMENLVGTLQDHWATLADSQRQADARPPARRDGRAPDWSGLLAQIDREAGRRADNNPFGFSNEIWDGNGGKLTDQRNSHSDAEFLRSLQGAVEWTDFDLLLRGLVELGARPLVLSMPIDGAFYDYTGVSAQARAVYYQGLRETTGRYGVPLLDFADHDNDKYFLIDPWSHLSRKGWIYFDRALDAFYHDALP